MIGRGRRKINITFLILLCIIALATYLRIYQLGAENLWLDEVGQLIAARHLTLHGILENVRGHSGATPLDYLILHLYLRIFNPKTEFGFRLPYALYGILSVLAIYYLGTELSNRIIGLAAAFALSVSTFHIWYSQELRFYSLSVLLAILSTYCFLRSTKKSQGRCWLTLGVLYLAGLYTYYFFAFVILAHFIYLLVYSTYLQRAEKKTIQTILFAYLLPFLISMVSSIILFTPWYLWAGVEEINNIPLKSQVILTTVFKAVGARFGGTSWIMVYTIPQVFTLLVFPKGILITLLILIPLLGALAIDIYSGYFFNVRQLLLALPFLILGFMLTGEFIVNFVLSQINRKNPKSVKSVWLMMCGLTMVLSFLWFFPNYQLLNDYFQTSNKRNWRGLVQHLEHLNTFQNRIATLTTRDWRPLVFYVDHLGVHPEKTPILNLDSEQEWYENTLCKKGDGDIWIVNSVANGFLTKPVIQDRLDQEDIELMKFPDFNIYIYPDGSDILTETMRYAYEADSIVEPMELEQSSSDIPYVSYPNSDEVELTSKNGYTDFKISIETAGEYHICGYARGRNRNSDSFTVSVDGGEPIGWDLPNDDHWSWVIVPSFWTLKPGLHHIRVHAREKGAKLHAIRLIASR